MARIVRKTRREKILENQIPEKQKSFENQIPEKQKSFENQIPEKQKSFEKLLQEKAQNEKEEAVMKFLSAFGNNKIIVEPYFTYVYNPKNVTQIFLLYYPNESFFYEALRISCNLGYFILSESQMDQFELKIFSSNEKFIFEKIILFTSYLYYINDRNFIKNIKNAVVMLIDMEHMLTINVNNKYKLFKIIKSMRFSLYYHIFKKRITPEKFKYILTSKPMNKKDEVFHVELEKPRTRFLKNYLIFLEKKYPEFLKKHSKSNTVNGIRLGTVISVKDGVVEQVDYDLFRR